MDKMESRETPLDILILAAGLGTRMRSETAKVLHQIDGRPLIAHVCETALKLNPRKVYTVIGHQGEKVKEAVHRVNGDTDFEFAIQKSQLGTGDAVNAARDQLANEDSMLVVLSGDVPLIKAETLEKLVKTHLSGKRVAACTILTVELDDPYGYGRVVRDSKHEFLKIVEQKDGNESELAVKEVNSGIYCFNTRMLFNALSEVKDDNAQGEFYLTEVPRILKERGEKIAIYTNQNPVEIEGINNRKQLAEIETALRVETIERMMVEDGVSFIDPSNTYISAQAKIGMDTIIYPGVSIEGKSEIGNRCVIRAGTRIANSKIGDEVEILDNCVINDAKVGDKCNIGPFAHLRPAAVMEEGSKIGNFVEMKKSILGKGSKANHLSYLGDATIGENSNIGAGTITCNYDGKNKHLSEIGDRVKIGSDTMIIAPVKIGDGAATGAGSVVTKDIESNRLAVGAPAKEIRDMEDDD